MLLSAISIACTQKLICPAYQSSFIHDKDELRKKFSYFENDSTPKVLTASKTKYLIAVPESYRKRYRKMQTVPLKEVHPVVPDSLLEGKKPEVDSLVSVDSLGRTKIDSTKQEVKDSVHYVSAQEAAEGLDDILNYWGL